MVVRDIGDTSVQLSWSRGFDNHSPIARYLIEARTLLSSQWKQMRTSECPHSGTGGTPRSLANPGSVLLLSLFLPLWCYWILQIP